MQPEVEAALAALNDSLKGHPQPFTVSTGGWQGKPVRFDAKQNEPRVLPSGDVVAAGKLLEWEVPREAPVEWPEAAREPLERFWNARIARQREIDASIAARADYEYLYDKPHEDRKVVRVAGPFTVESLSPHRELKVDEDGDFVENQVAEPGPVYGREADFAQIILENLKTAGVQQADKQGKIDFSSLVPWPGGMICAEGRYVEGGSGRGVLASEGEEDGRGDSATPLRSAQNDRVAGSVRNDGITSSAQSVGMGGSTQNDGTAVSEQGDGMAGSAQGYDKVGNGDGKEVRAGIFIGPEFGTVARADLVEAAREAAEAGFEVLIACAFNFDAHASEFDKLGRIPVLKARMNADLHMAEDLKNTGKGNLFVVFGEPDIEIRDVEDGQIQVRLKGVDVFHPQSGEIRSSAAADIACWFIDTDYNEESFFVRHAYFLGANDPYKSLKTTLKAEINPEAWGSLNSDLSRPFPKPATGRIAVKVINHLGDEVIKVFRVWEPARIMLQKA